MVGALVRKKGCEFSVSGLRERERGEKGKSDRFCYWFCV